MTSLTVPTVLWRWTKGERPFGTPKPRRMCQKLPAIDGSRMSIGRRSEIEGWADFLEQFLPWIALFDDRIPEELHRAMVSDTVIKQSALDKGQSVRSTRTFLYLKQALQNFPWKLRRSSSARPPDTNASEGCTKNSALGLGLKHPLCEPRSYSSRPRRRAIDHWIALETCNLRCHVTAG